MTLRERIAKVNPSPFFIIVGDGQMHTRFTPMPKAFCGRDFYELEPVDFADMLLDLRAELRLPGIGIAHFFQVARLGQQNLSCGMFALRKHSVILVKLVSAPIQHGVLDFDFTPIDFGKREFNRLPVPVAGYIPWSLFSSREMARREKLAVPQ